MPSVLKLSRVSKSKVDTEDGPGSLCALQPGSLDSLSGTLISRLPLAPGPLVLV